MSIKEKIKQELEELNEAELQKISALIDALKGKKNTRTASLTPRDFDGRLDNRNLRDLAYSVSHIATFNAKDFTGISEIEIVKP